MNELFGPGVKFSFSSRKDGPMNFVGHEYYDGERRANRGSFISHQTGLHLTDAVTPKVMHTGRAEVVSKHNPLYGAIACDALITDKKNLVLTMTAGDCPPIALYDPVNEVIALIHAGWKPLYAGIIEHTIDAMRIQLNCHAGNIKAYIGPGICRDCYEIKGDVAGKFGIEVPRSGKLYFSLAEEADKRLREQGVRKENILATMECTAHTNEGEKYYSHRREPTDPPARQMALFVMR